MKNNQQAKAAVKTVSAHLAEDEAELKSVPRLHKGTLPLGSKLELDTTDKCNHRMTYKFQHKLNIHKNVFVIAKFHN